MILTLKYKKDQDKVYEFYIKNLDFVNNWDLVDLSCYKIVGEYLLERREKMGDLRELALSGHLWRKRVAMVSTLAFIKNG